MILYEVLLEVLEVALALYMEEKYAKHPFEDISLQQFQCLQIVITL